VKLALTEEPVTSGAFQVGTEISIGLEAAKGTSKEVVEAAEENFGRKINEFKAANPSADIKVVASRDIQAARPVEIAVDADEIDAGVFEKLVNELADTVGQ